MTTLLFVTPHVAAANALPTRPQALLDALAATGAFAEVVVVNRLRPDTWLGRRSPVASGPGVRTVRHPWPFGRLERRYLARLARTLEPPVVCWIADPKSAIVLADLPGGAIRVLDAYDAWDRSPLVRGGRRRRAVVAGYRAAGAHADVVFTNTPAMADRLRAFGARDVHVLPNAAPPPRPVTPDRDPSLIYVGRIHERFSCALVAAVADASPDVPIDIVGPVERMPDGWEALVARRNIRLRGALPGPAARDAIGRSRGLLVPHVPDDYARSQDAMKAWDALSVGAPVLSTSVPPADAWTPGLAIVADDPTGFADGARRLVAGALDDARPARIAFAAANGWSDRAAAVLAALHRRESGGHDT